MHPLFRDSLCKKAFSTGGKSEIGGRGGSKMTPKNRISFMDGPKDAFAADSESIRLDRGLVT